MDTSAHNKESFWKTLPGTITAIAGLVTAIGGLIAILAQLGVFDSAESTPTTTATTPAKTEVPVTATAAPQSAPLTTKADDVEYTILSKKTEEYSPSELKVILNMKVSCKETSVGFTADMFRLEVDGIKYQPHNSLSSHWIANHADWKEKLEFVIPKPAPSATLLVGQVGTERIGRIALSLP